MFEARARRIALGIGVPALAALACWALLAGFAPDCLFYRATGLYCPGCGSGRALAAVIHGDLPAAFGYNPMLFLLGVPALFVFLHEWLRVVFPGLGLRPVTLSQPVILSCVIAILAYWVLRNLPALGFLAPL